MEKATFGAGCFWHVEDAFGQVKGVINTAVGFMGGTTKNPTYHDVCTGRTGHAEVVQLEYDPKKVSYGELLLDIYGSPTGATVCVRAMLGHIRNCAMCLRKFQNLSNCV